MDLLTIKVWFPGTSPDPSTAELTLSQPSGLHFFLESLAHGQSLIGDESFSLALYWDQTLIHFGTYHVHFVDVGDPKTVDDPAPVRLIVDHETPGVHEGMIAAAWQEMVKATDLFGHSKE